MTIRTSTSHVYAARNMNVALAGFSPMLRGPMIPHDVDDDGGADAAAAAAAEEAEAKRLAEEAANKDKKPTDAEAALLKDVMKQKKAKEAAETAAKEAADKLAKYEGVDVERYKALVAKAEETERAELEAKGEYERILKTVKEQSEARIKEAEEATNTTRAQLEEAQRQIDELTIGHDFSTSKFLTEKTVYTPKKARALFGAHFDRVGAVTVGYDKPRGEKDRTPLVNAAGDYLSFEDAIEKIVTSDEDFERFAKSSLKPGSGSTGSQHKPEDKATKKEVTGTNRIAANLAKLTATGAK